MRLQNYLNEKKKTYQYHFHLSHGIHEIEANNKKAALRKIEKEWGYEKNRLDSHVDNFKIWEL